MTEMREMMGSHVHVDPDAQATVTDFIDYTEYLSSDLERALTLIGKLDRSYESKTEHLHELLETYCTLPQGDDKQANARQAEQLRAQISHDLDLTLSVREASFVEASRLHEDVQRHRNRLGSIHSKLLALPKPPSRDPTPQPVQSPQATRDATGDHPRIKLRLDASRASAQAQASRRNGVISSRPTKRIIVPGEVLPPPNPDSPTASMYDESSSTESSEEEPTPPPEPQPRVRPNKPNTIRIPRLKPPKSPKARKERAPRAPGQMGTNVHSAVAGISTSNALMLLSPPPPDVKLGSEHAPWMRLTEYEMAKLRKRMKKNAIWAPSDTMIRRELSDAGRGPDAYHRARQIAEEQEEELVDCDDLANKDKNRPLLPGEIPLDVKTKIFNKGMSLNVQKKKKKEKDQALQAQQAKLEAAQSDMTLNSLGTRISTLFTKPHGAVPNYMASPIPQTGDKIVLKSARKRKREHKETVSPTEESKANAQLHSEIILASKPASKKRKRAPSNPAAAGPSTAASSTDQAQASATEHLAVNGNAPRTTATSTTVPLAAAAPSPVKAATPAPQPGSPSGTRRNKHAHVSIATKDTDTAAPPLMTAPGTSSKPPSRPASRRASAGAPAEPINREHLRRKSVTPAPAPLAPTTATRLRSRRPAPGPVQSSHEGGAAVSIGKRKNAPRKKGAVATAAGAAAQRKLDDKAAWAGGRKLEDEENLEEEAVDPDEETYCVCGGVSFGTMILCENETVSSFLSPPPHPTSFPVFEGFGCPSWGLGANAVVSPAVREGVVPPRVRGSEGATRAQNEVVVSGLREEDGCGSEFVEDRIFALLGVSGRRGAGWLGAHPQERLS
ncbi:MAG: hypothetical protein LQ340_001006 [Diploschistes diacapsis]|nr:MAG: hypothetical protein LQ340_001006 [Diploschistes diacapsis]